MLDFDLRRRPALPAGVGLLAGVALSDAVSTFVGPMPWLSGLLLLLALLAGRRVPGLQLVCAGLAMFGVGAWIESQDASAFAGRLDAALPAHRPVAESHFTGEVLAPVEPAGRGDRWLRLRARPEGPASGSTVRHLLLRVRASPPGPTADLERLGVGDRVRVWCRVRRPRRPGNPGDLDPWVALRGRRIDALGSVKSARLVERLESGRPTPGRVAGLAKRFGRRRLDDALGAEGPVRALAGAMLLGDRGALGGERLRTMRRSGLVHLVAISGLHVGLLVWMFHSLLGRLRAGGFWRLSILAVALYGFSLGVGLRASVQRAVLAAGAVLLGRCIGRDGDALNGLVLLAAVLVGCNPGSARDPAFQLTFLATGGILLLAPRLAASLPLPGFCGTAVAVSLSAYLATVPAIAWHFGLLAPVGLLSNLIAAPLCGVILVTGYATIVLGTAPGFGEAAAWSLSCSVEGLLRIAELSGSWSPGSWVVPRPSMPIVALCYGLLLLYAGASVNHARRAELGLLAGLGLVLVWIHLGPPPPAGTGVTEARVIDVGQGLAVAARGPHGGGVLVDAGGGGEWRFDAGERIVVPFLLGWSGRRLDVLMVTHDHLDHAGGAFAVLRELEVGELWLGPGSLRDPVLSALATLARERGTAVVLAERGHRSLRAGLPLHVLGPPREDQARDSNQRSIVLLAGVEPCRLLIPGDLEREGEQELLSSGVGLRSEALILGHHGSRTASSAAFLAQVGPAWAIVSAGAGNPFGHPHPIVTGRVERLGIALFRTDRDGQVELRATAGGWQVRATARRRGSGGR